MDPETLKDNRPNPEEQLQAQVEEARAHQESVRAMRAAIEHWGKSGEEMLKAKMAGKSDREAAQAARIAPSTLHQRFRKLKNLLSR